MSLSCQIISSSAEFSRPDLMLFYPIVPRLLARILGVLWAKIINNLIFTAKNGKIVQNPKKHFLFFVVSFKACKELSVALPKEHFLMWFKLSLAGLAFFFWKMTTTDCGIANGFGKIASSVEPSVFSHVRWKERKLSSRGHNPDETEN